MRELKARVAVITGASRGIGRHIAEALAAEGCRLAIAARDEAALEAVAEAIRSTHQVEVIVVPTDVSERAQMDALVDAAKARLGGVDILVNNAALERSERFDESDPEQTAMDLRVNVHAPMYLARLVLPEMLKAGRGHIVNIASLAGLGANPHGESYVASKHAMVGFTRALRASLKSQGSPVSASSVCPGFVHDVGMFARKQAANGVRPPAIMGSSSPQAVAKAVIRCIRKDTTEVIVNPMPIRPFLVLSILWPRFGEWLMRRLGIHRLSEAMVDACR